MRQHGVQHSLSSSTCIARILYTHSQESLWWFQGRGVCWIKLLFFSILAAISLAFYIRHAVAFLPDLIRCLDPLEPCFLEYRFCLILSLQEALSLPLTITSYLQTLHMKQFLVPPCSSGDDRQPSKTNTTREMDPCFCSSRWHKSPRRFVILEWKWATPMSLYKRLVRHLQRYKKIENTYNKDFEDRSKDAGDNLLLVLEGWSLWVKDQNT